jgi:hypothetical protein
MKYFYYSTIFGFNYNNFRTIILFLTTIKNGQSTSLINYTIFIDCIEYLFM